MAAMEVDEVPKPVVDEEEEEAEPEERSFPNMDLAQTVFALEASPGDAAVTSAVMEAVRTDKMGAFFEYLVGKYPSMADAGLAAELKAANTEELATLKAAIEDAEQNHGETEVLDALFAVAAFHARIGDKQEAYAAFDTIIAKPKVSTGKKIDASMAKLRVSLFFMDTDTTRTLLRSAKKLVEDGGDWDRRNRLKVYEAVFFMIERDFKSAAELLLEGVATFTCTELCSYETFIFYAVLTNMLYLKRPELKKKIVDGPEVLGVLHLPELDPLPVLVNGLYDCEYAGFFNALVTLNDNLLKDRYIARHARYLIREYRILVYSQYLDAYKSVMLGTMANAFGVGQPFLDQELSRFIATSRLNAKIDKVGGMVITNRPDVKNAQYHAVIKKGDMLLNQIQKLARVIDV